MKRTPDIRHISRATRWFSGLAVVYIVLQLILQPNTATIRQFHLSLGEYHVLSLLVSIPSLAAWFAAFYGYAKLEKYADRIDGAPEGQAFTHISKGLKYLAWGLPITSLISTILGALAHSWTSFGGAAIIISHYVTLAISLLAFSKLNRGTRYLTEAGGKSPTLNATRWLMASFIIVAVSYSAGIVASLHHGLRTNYHLPLWLILFTIVIPYLYAWLMGLLSAYEISLYRRHAPGILYQRGLNYVASGLCMAVLASVILQFLTSGSPYLRRITFSWSALTVYMLLILYAAGFVVISIGAHKLNKIEEV